MEKIQLLYVENVIRRKAGQLQQQLNFFMLVENLGYDKQVNIVWAGEDGVWNTLPANFHSVTLNNKEYWQAKTNIDATKQQSLAGNIQFGLQYRIVGSEYWDSNNGENYTSEADSGVMLGRNKSVQNVNFENYLLESQQTVPVSIAINLSSNIEKVTLHWTTDSWKTTHTSPCRLKRNHWHKEFRSNARNPNQYGVQIWTGKIKIDDAYRLEYSFCCEGNDRIIWENNYDENYSIQRDQLKFLILNLHCYQEENQDEKFTTIAKAISDLDVDVVCLQEVAEYWRDGEGDWESNSAKIINDRLPKPFHIHTDWSHLGFEKYREGVAILSRFPLTHHESKYISDSDDIYNIHSRNVVKAQINAPSIGPINVFSAHLSWLEDGFQQQYQRLHKWAEACAEDVKTTMLCGDFNITAGSSGYELVVEDGNYEDQFLAANEQGSFEKIFKVNDPHWQQLLSDDYRIDYIFMNKNSGLKINSAKVIFTEQDYGRVSDHCGYFMTFEPRIAVATDNSEALK